MVPQESKRVVVLIFQGSPLH